VKLSKILSQVKTDFETSAEPDFIDQITVEDIAIDSRLVKKNSIFFALPGKVTTGAEFISGAIANGASAIIVEKIPTLVLKAENVCFIESKNVFSLLVDFLKVFYTPLPANIYAITGTNGKTSTAEFTRQILEFLGKKSASIGTLGVICSADIEGLQNSSLTTPDIVSLYKNLQILKKNGVNDVALEVSSIGLEQGRAAGIKLDVGAFTNFTQDHLDYHKSMEEYFRCKMILFSKSLNNKASAVLNSDIVEFPQIKKICEEKKYRLIEYGFKARYLRLLEIKQNLNEQKVIFEFGQKKYDFELAVAGEFQVFNALCALGNVLAKYDLDETALRKLLTQFNQLHPAAGRMQRVATLPNKAQIFIDFAHSPDALQNVLQLARKITKARVILLFGCGGDRDAKKRPIMGGLACELADLVIVTDDNPRSEDAKNIRREILNNCDSSKTLEITDRKTAIEKAITLLQNEDVLILAGKGHEKYQIIGKEKFEFDEEKIVKDVIRKLA
jgi:UDP-N-acetylmuramoyl-L-alanyl-D-glutamate--2,6-diaminopimelate ligase